jgi:hypothetical protein
LSADFFGFWLSRVGKKTNNDILPTADSIGMVFDMAKMTDSEKLEKVIFLTEQIASLSFYVASLERPQLGPTGPINLGPWGEQAIKKNQEKITKMKRARGQYIGYLRKRLSA